MIGYSIVSDNAYAPEQSNSIYISKTNQKSSISYITTLRHYRKIFFRNKPLDQYGASILSEDLSLLQFTLRQHILRYGVCQFKNHVIPYPSTLNYKLSVRTATNNQLNICNILTRTSAKFWHQHLVLQTYLAIGKHIKVSDWFLTKNRWWNTYWQRSKKNSKADIPINKLFGENLFDHHSHQFQNLFETEEAFWSSASAEHWFLEKKVYKREFLLIFAYTVSYWPGSYALRGVIEFGCMLKDGGSPFSLALFNVESWTKLWMLRCLSWVLT